MTDNQDYRSAVPINSIKMKKFKIVPLSQEFADDIRSAKVDNFGNDVKEQLATGRGPCRVSLRPFIIGRDVRLLFFT